MPQKVLVRWVCRPLHYMLAGCITCLQPQVDNHHGSTCLHMCTALRKEFFRALSPVVPFEQGDAVQPTKVSASIASCCCCVCRRENGRKVPDSPLTGNRRLLEAYSCAAGVVEYRHALLQLLLHSSCSSALVAAAKRQQRCSLLSLLPPLA